MHRSGSTLQYQIAKSLCEARGPLIAHDGWNDTPVESSHDNAETHIVKIHWPNRNLERSLNQENCRYIYSYRDERDVLASFQSKGVTLGEENTRKTVNEEMAAYRVFTSRTHVLTTRYEDFVSRVPDLIEQIGGYLGFEVGAEERDDLAAQLDLNVQRNRVKELSKHTDSNVLCKETRLTRNHVGDARSGKWPEVLAPEIAELANELARDWLSERGYT